MKAFFENITVLELASVLAGPSVGQFFAELGARVIKVENPQAGGDVTRSWALKGEAVEDGVTAYFSAANWGKESIAVNLATAEGRGIVQALAAKVDVVLASYKPGDAEKLGMDYASLSKENPRLLYGHITGFGTHSHKVGYDALIQAESGFMYMNGAPGGDSLKMPVALMDLLAAHQLKEALLVGLLERTQTGKGGYWHVSLLQAAVASLANQGTNWLQAGHNPGKMGSEHPNIMPYGTVCLTQDKKELLLAVGSNKQFFALCEVLDIPDLAHDARFLSNTQRVQHREALRPLLAQAVAQCQSAWLMEQLEARKVPAGLIRSVQDVFELPEARELLLTNGRHAGMRHFVGSQAGGPSEETSHLLPPPAFGQHTHAVLSALLNAAPEQLAAWRQRGAIA